jgi:hypothetical protein
MRSTGGDRRAAADYGARAERPGKNFIRVLIGDRVRLELSPRDVRAEG